MAKVLTIFENLEKLLNTEGQCRFVTTHGSEDTNDAVENDSKSIFTEQTLFLHYIITEINSLTTELKHDDTVLISVKNQKTLRTCFQLITSLGISRCLIPGLGISLSKRCTSAGILHPIVLSDEEKYELLTKCTDFFTRCYAVPVLKNIIVTLHLSDYLAALIQLAFAPLKKPGTYSNFVMTQDLYKKLNYERLNYKMVYENLVANCFQPILMKGLLVLQGVTNPHPPSFVKSVIAKEMSRRLLAPGGLLSLIRCFIESYSIDTGFEWKKIDLISKIVAAKHGNISKSEYLNNICSQLKNILLSNNTHYLSTAVACVLALNEKYPQSDALRVLIKNSFQSLVYDELVSKPHLPGTIVMTAQEVERAVNVLHACVCTTKLDWPTTLLQPNLCILFAMGVKCTKNEDMKTKIKEILLKLFETLSPTDIMKTLALVLFGNDKENLVKIFIEEYEAGVILKYVSQVIEYPKKESLEYFINLYKASVNLTFVQALFESSLEILIDLTEKRKAGKNIDFLITPEDDPIIFNNVDERYIDILQLLSEICTYPKVISTLKESPTGVLNFIEYFLMRNFGNSNDECVTVALVLLNTILENASSNENFRKLFNNVTPILKKMADDESGLNNMLCKEALSLIKCNKPQQPETPCAKAISDVFNQLLPVRAHGIIELTKLINAKDPETISKKHFIFCLFQDQLKESDSYIYLAAINGLASLGSLCTEDVLHVLCKEFIQISVHRHIKPLADQNKAAELKMKIGDIIVKVTRKLGEMAIVHKTILLNTMLSGCRHEDPLIRTSAISNLAEIALVLHYRVGSIIYEILLCVRSIIETDPAVECRRAAVMVISSLLKGLGKETLIELKDNLLPIYRTLKELYRDPDEDPAVRLHAQIALEELNDIVKQFLFPAAPLGNQTFVLDTPKDIVFK